MSQLILRVLCAIFLLIGVGYQTQVGAAQQADADWYKRVAPEKCISYVAWNNDAEKVIEGNATQELMADPDVRAFVDDMKKRVGLFAPAMMSEQEIMPQEKLELLHTLSPKLVASVFERSGCMFVEEVDLGRNMEGPAAIKAAMLVDLGNGTDKFVAEMAKMAGSKDQPLAKVELAGTMAYRFDLVDDAGKMYFGHVGEVFVVAISEQAYVGAVERMKGSKTPVWLAELDTKSQVLKHVHSLAYLDVNSVMRSLRKAFGPNSNVVGELLGVSSVEEIQVVGGLDSEGSATHVLVEASELEGVLGLLAKNPVNDALFENVPSDSLGAMAMTLDVDGLLELIKTAETIMGPGSGFDEFKQQFRNNTGVDLEADLVRHLGDSWMLYNGASDGWLSGMTLVGEVKNATKLTTAIEKFFKAAGEQVKQMPAGYRPGLFKQDYAGETIYSMTFPGMFVEVSFCVQKDRIFIGMFPQAVMTAVKGLPADEVLMDDMQVKKLNDSSFLKGDVRLSGMIYLDAKLQAQVVYPYMQFIKAAVSAIFRYQAVPNTLPLLEGMELPPARTVIRKIKPTTVLVRTNEQGIEIEARQTIPTNGVVASIPVGIGMLLPAVGQVRKAARQTESLNNLRQMALASLNYESAHMKFPVDDEKFSWRVRILPFLEEGNLHDQINFDEPWDSEHNKKILAKTPKLFQAPESKVAEGMTVYRSFKGTLGGNDGKGIGFRQITDGSSNTILVAQVPDEMATHWAKPDSLEVNDDVAKKLLAGKGEFLTAFCDGSVHRLPATLGADDLKNLLNPNDGNLVDIYPQFRNRRMRQKDVEADPRFILPSKKKSF